LIEAASRSRPEFSLRIGKRQWGEIVEGQKPNPPVRVPDEDWEAAVWTTGAHWDHAVRQALVGMDEAENALSTRALGWAFWPFTDELLSAAVGLQDPCGISEVIAKIELVLDERWARVEGGVEHLEAEGDHLPILPRGLFAFEGFRWEA
jgi:hypothetical protein